MFEEGQSFTQEHISLLRSEFDSLTQDNKEMKKGIVELTEMVKKDYLSRNRGIDTGQPPTPQTLPYSTSVSHSPQTPTHFATVNDSTSNLLSKSRSVNWEGFAHPGTTHPFELSARYVDPSSLPEHRQPTLRTFTNPQPINLEQFTPQYQYIPSSLNPFAPPLYFPYPPPSTTLPPFLKQPQPLHIHTRPRFQQALLCTLSQL